MTVIDEIEMIRKEFHRAMHLLEVDSLKDPVQEPYRSKYAAKKIFKDIKPKVEKILSRIEPDNPHVAKCKVTLASVMFNLGTISYETEEISEAEKQFTSCLSYLEDDPLKPESILIILQVLNHLGTIASNRGKRDLAEKFLKRAEKLYTDFKANGEAPKTSYQSFAGLDDEISKENAREIMENIHTHTAYYLAQVYEKFGEGEKAKKYCNTTLKKQLAFSSFMPTVMDWIMNTALLSEAFMKSQQYRLARHHLAAASYMLDKIKNECVCKNEESKEEYRRVGGHVARAWGTYGAFLLSASREKLVTTDNEVSPPKNTSKNITSEKNDVCCKETSGDSTPAQEHSKSSKSASDNNDEPKNDEIQDEISQSDEDDMLFDGIDVSKYENEIACEKAQTLDEAKKLFVSAQMWLNKAKEYFSLEDAAPVFMEIMRVTTRLYWSLSFFETDIDKQYKMHMKRCQLLEPLLNQLNPQFYSEIIHQVWYEIAVAQSDLHDNRYIYINDPTINKGELTEKINHHAERSIYYFQKFIDVSVDSRTRKLSPSLDPDLLRPCLLSYFCIGRLYYKMIGRNRSECVELLKKSFDFYAFIVDFCDKNPEAMEIMKVEYAVAKDMSMLLPYRLKNLVYDEGQ